MRNKNQIYEEFLVISAQMGDRKSLEALIKHRSPQLFSHACGLMGNREEAADIVQDAWLEITRGLRNLKEPRAFSTWAYRIVSRRCAKAIGQNIKHRNIAKTQAEMPKPDQPDQSDVQAIRGAINALPPGQSVTIRLFYLEDFSVKQVAAALDIPVGTVKTRLMHARKTLKSILKGDQDV
ncbi:MAG: RNA polymerase sigma factor [Rhodobacteraceae bacterium]|nr:RNA polymerase sigma factor [Paracoccaceae bacterium]